MTKMTLTAVEWIEQRHNERIEVLIKEGKTYSKCANTEYMEAIHQLYEKAVWIDANTNGGCVADPFFCFHFYEEEDAVAFKLRWS